MRKVIVVGLLLLTGCGARMRPMGEQTKTALDQQLLILANKNALARLAGKLNGKVTLPANVILSGPNSDLIESLLEIDSTNFRVSKSEKSLKLISMINGIDWTFDAFGVVNVNEHMAMAELVVPLAGDVMRGMAAASAKDFGMFGPVVELMDETATAGVFERKVQPSPQAKTGGMPMMHSR